uniref:Uncharacterized protein n=1 Tax=Chromera velia CCMP2878 TaxID=1169474 RepID=A0A0G4FSM2_9ALVE|eukprot:Cvel_18409.t1-p1 / transcript=Cvel_18409.t1 / gene=Cvel_18409 / organism=Chromera_velia_CCMP2878 / gene_product=hypothetical protein / transcript_product=hypothetical protein / location=Cvel_scaffold1522:34231-35212(-) / protein_length=191 / sequence_SO=supercontig / SO=protein_coding / is_pseudo=false
MLLGFIYMLLKHLADVAMSRGVLQRLEKKRENVQPSFYSSLYCCFQRGAGGGRVTPQADAEGETERLLHTHTNRNAQQAHGVAGAVSEEGGGDLEGGRGGLGSQTAAETDAVGDEGGEGEDGEGEEGLESRMEARVEKEGGLLFKVLLFISYSLYDCINETIDFLQDALSVGSVLNSATLAAQPVLPTFLI